MYETYDFSAADGDMYDDGGGGATGETDVSREVVVAAGGEPYPGQVRMVKNRVEWGGIFFCC